jgi:TolB-like protein
MKKAIVFIIFTCFLPVTAFSQNALTLDTALNNSTTYFSGRIPSNTKVVVLNFTSKWPDLSDYIIEELIGYFVNDGKLAVVDRQNLETIRREMDFQLSGEVSDETAQSIGRKLGAQTIISGAITAIADEYRLRIRAISVETAQILGMQNVDIMQDKRIAALTGTAFTGPANTAPNTSNTPQTATNVSTPQITRAPVIFSQSDLNWKPYSKSGSTVNIKTSEEKIDGNIKNVSTIDIFLGKSGSYTGAITEDQTFVQALIVGNGVRFKVIGDGKGWFFSIQTKEYIIQKNNFDQMVAHGFFLTTKNGQVVEVDIPFSRLRIPTINTRNWTSSPTFGFSKASIIGMVIERNNYSLGHESGPSTIKIFDLEIY